MCDENPRTKRSKPRNTKTRCEAGLNGCPTKAIRNQEDFHDIIELFEKPSSRIYEIIRPLQAQSLSISEISLKTGIKRTAIWDTLKKFEKPVKRSDPSRYARWRKGHQRTGARPPYGFSILEGDVVPEPKEYSTLLVIYRLWKQGAERMDILLRLEELGLKSRTGRAWSYGVIRLILERFVSLAIVEVSGKLILSDKFLKGILFPTKATKSNRRVK